jgi:hypothetical protein
MWEASSPDDKLTGDLGSVIETTQIGGRRSDRLMAGKLSPGNFGLLQQYRHIATNHILIGNGRFRGKADMHGRVASIHLAVDDPTETLGPPGVSDCIYAQYVLLGNLAA